MSQNVQKVVDVTAAAVYVPGAAAAFFAQTLPTVQWIAGVLAAVAAALAIASRLRKWLRS